MGRYTDGKEISSETGQEQGTISFAAFLTIMLQQLKDKDTADGLLSAFRTLANGKDTLPTAEMERFLKPQDMTFLTAQLAPVEGGYEYAQFASSVYGTSDDAQP